MYQLILIMPQFTAVNESHRQMLLTTYSVNYNLKKNRLRSLVIVSANLVAAVIYSSKLVAQANVIDHLQL